MIVNLGMYDMPETQHANDAFWHAIRAELGFGPAEITRSDNLWSIWRDADLLFAQTCGFPYRTKLHGNVQIIGTPDYGLAGCAPGYYCSVFVARANDPRRTLSAFDGATFAFNEPLSQSGWAAPVHHMMSTRIRPGKLHQSGGHALSARAVANGVAEFAALDALTWDMLGDHAPDLTKQLRVLARTEPTPTLPYITSLTQDAAVLRAAVASAITRLDPQHRNTLHLKGLVQIDVRTYLDVPTPDTPEGLVA